jgi:hypothetical protein
MTPVAHARWSVLMTWLRASLIVVCLLCGAARAADPAPPVAPEPFFRHADYGALRLSPSGKYVGALVPIQGRMGLAVLDVEGKAIKNVANAADQDIGWFAWVNDERLVFSLIDLQKGLGEQTGGGLFAINRDGTDYRELAPTAKATFDRMSRYHGAAPLRMLRDGSDDILMIVYDLSERYPDVYRVNTRTARRTLKSLDKPGDVDEWFADRSGAVRAAVVDDKGGSRVYWRAGEDAKWVEIGRYGIRGARMEPVEFDGDGSLIVASDEGRDTFALYRYDPVKHGLGELIAAHPTSDLDHAALVFDRRKNRFVGLRYEAERPGEAWFDDDWARLAKGVNNALPDHDNVLQREGADRVLIHSSSDRDPGTYYLLDLKSSRLEPLVVTRKAVRPDAMPKRTPMRYAARDGLSIPAYLTLPPGKPARNLPLVVHVHGGPYVHGNHWEWDPEAAYLATLGYAVLQPEFRGSMGWGRKLYEAGWKQWGLGMQDDRRRRRRVGEAGHRRSCARLHHGRQLRRLCRHDEPRARSCALEMRREHRRRDRHRPHVRHHVVGLLRQRLDALSHEGPDRRPGQGCRDAESQLAPRQRGAHQGARADGVWRPGPARAARPRRAHARRAAKAGHAGGMGAVRRRGPRLHGRGHALRPLPTHRAVSRRQHRRGCAALAPIRTRAGRTGRGR